MAINPPSDIVLDVLKAADPERARLMTQRLNSLSAGSVGDSGGFTRLLDQKGFSPASSPSKEGLGGSVQATLLKRASPASSKTQTVETDFDASILSSFVKELLPKNTEDVFGSGNTGEIWKSMLGDQIARQIAKSGELGISKRLFATHPYNEHGRNSLQSLKAQDGLVESTAQASANPLSLSSSVEPENGGVLFANRKVL